MYTGPDNVLDAVPLVIPPAAPMEKTETPPLLWTSKTFPPKPAAVLTPRTDPFAEKLVGCVAPSLKYISG
jgi:hypothetical protein